MTIIRLSNQLSPGFHQAQGFVPNQGLSSGNKSLEYAYQDVFAFIGLARVSAYGRLT